MEIWKDVKNYDGIYQVSNYGRVKAVKKPNKFGVRCRGDIKSIFGHSLGYRRVRFFDTTRYVHDIVAESFLDRPLYKCEINHKNLDKGDNRADNLEYMTHRENIQHAQDVEPWSRYKKTKRLDHIPDAGKKA